MIALRRRSDQHHAPTAAQLHKHYGRALRMIAEANLWDGIPADVGHEGRRRFRNVCEYLGAQSEAAWHLLAKMPVDEFTRQMSEAERCS